MNEGISSLVSLAQNSWSGVDEHLKDVLLFFVSDLVKILLLLVVITILMSVIRHFLPFRRFKDLLHQRRLFGLDYFLASGLGAITPFCSCSSIPLFIGFIQAGIPLGVAFAFLITSPLINEVALALLVGIFGWKVTGIYVISGILIGVSGGFILQKLKMEKYVIDLVEQKIGCHCRQSGALSGRQIVGKVLRESGRIIKKVLPYLVVGVGLGSLIHGYVPQDFFVGYLQKAGFLSVPIAVILAVPLYSNASGVIPIIESLIAKGVPLGTGLAFMMAIVGLSLPEAMILKKVMRLKLLGAFFGIVTVGIIILGYLFNIIL